jgi:F-box protein 21
MRLERALGAFDMFMLHDNEGDLDEVCSSIKLVSQRMAVADFLSLWLDL